MGSVTGGAGFIGSHAVDRLVGDGHAGATPGMPARGGEPRSDPERDGELQRLPEQHRASLVKRFDVRDVKSIAINVNEKYVSLPQPARVFLRAPYREISRAPVGQHR